jgi:hypothetical protein
MRVRAILRQVFPDEDWYRGEPHQDTR